MMISFNDTIIKRLKSMYISYHTTAALSAVCLLPLHSFTICHFPLSSPTAAAHGFLTFFIALPGRAHACPLPGANNAPVRLTSITRRRSARWADHVISFPAARARTSRLACHVTTTWYWNALTPRPSWIGSNTGLAYKPPPQVNRYTCWAGWAPTTTTHAATH